MKSTQEIRDVYRDKAERRMAQPYDYEGITVPVMAYELLEILDDADRCAELEKAGAAIAKRLRELADEHDKCSALASPTYTGSSLRMLADALEGKP